MVAVIVVIIVGVVAGYSFLSRRGGGEYAQEILPDTEAWKAVKQLEFTPLAYLPVPWAAAETVLENGDNVWDVRCWSGHFVSNHVWGCGRWYLSGSTLSGATPITMPTRGILVDNMYWGTPLHEVIIDSYNHPKNVVNGQEVYFNMSFSVYLSKYVVVEFGHVDLLASIVEGLKNSADGYIILEAGELLGYGSSGASACDFAMYDSRVNNQMYSKGFIQVSETAYAVSELNSAVCPLNYFADNLRQKILESYNKRHQIDTAGGQVSYESRNNPESRIDRPLNVNVEDTVWCFWADLTGEWATANHMIFLHRSKIDNETFNYQNIANDYSQSYGWVPTDDYLGLYTGYEDRLSYLFVYHVSGDDAKEGVLKIDGQSGYMPSRKTKYVKYKINLTGNTFGNTLTIEYFDTAGTAQGSFTQNARTLYRDAGAGCIILAKH